MSAAGRGSQRDPLDRYDTPAWCVDRLLDRVGPRFLEGSLRPQWMEPAVGGGAIVRAVDAWCRRTGMDAPAWWLCDLAPRCRLPWVTRRGDYAAGEIRPPMRLDVMPTNPPYRHALAFAQRGVQDAAHVALLLRVNWLEGACSEEPERYRFLRAHPPDVYVLPNRPHFERDGRPIINDRTGRKKGSDATAYAWVVWGLGGGSWELLDETPAEDRSAA